MQLTNIMNHVSSRLLPSPMSDQVTRLRMPAVEWTKLSIICGDTLAKGTRVDGLCGLLVAVKIYE